MSAVTIPESHRDLLVGSAHGVLATMMPDGQPQSSVVWVDFDGSHILLNTTLARQKVRNMSADPHVALLVIDPRNSSRWIEIRGRVVEISVAVDDAHIDKLAQRYAGKQHFYGDVRPLEQRQHDTRVIVRIEPIRVTLDAIFK